MSNLAPYAVSVENSLGRLYQEDKRKDNRNPFQRDIDRIIHSVSYRLLGGKTQVFNFYGKPVDNDYELLRTRMSHSQEVARLANYVGSELGLNKYLCEVLGLGHDLGHSAFGHVGQDVINDFMQFKGLVGGFEHNEQVLRIVDSLERPYLGFNGLNLMFETREGLLKHCKKESALLLGDVARRHLDKNRAQPTLEAQVVDWCDAIAYVHADLEDAFLIGIVKPSTMLKEVPGFAEAWNRLSVKNPLWKFPDDDCIDSQDLLISSTAERIVRSVIREMFRYSSADLLENTKKEIKKINPKSVEDVRRHSSYLAKFSNEQLKRHKDLKNWSRKNIYLNSINIDVRDKQKEIMWDLLCSFYLSPKEMNGSTFNRKNFASEQDFLRELADKVSIMSDNFAYREHERLKSTRPDLISEAKLMRKEFELVFSSEKQDGVSKNSVVDLTAKLVEETRRVWIEQDPFEFCGSMKKDIKKCRPK